MHPKVILITVLFFVWTSLTTTTTTTNDVELLLIDPEIFLSSPAEEAEKRKSSIPFQSRLTRNLAMRAEGTPSLFRSLSDRTVRRRGRAIHQSHEEQKRKVASQTRNGEGNRGEEMTLQYQFLHTNNKMFHCDICGQLFTTSPLRDDHKGDHEK